MARVSNSVSQHPVIVPGTSSLSLPRFQPSWFALLSLEKQNTGDLLKNNRNTRNKASLLRNKRHSQEWQRVREHTLKSTGQSPLWLQRSFAQRLSPICAYQCFFHTFSVLCSLSVEGIPVFSVNQFLFFNIFNFYVYRYVACYICAPRACSIHRIQKRALDVMELELLMTDSQPLGRRSWDLNPGLLEKQTVFLTIELSLQPQQISFVCKPLFYVCLSLPHPTLLPQFLSGSYIPGTFWGSKQTIIHHSLVTSSMLVRDSTHA